MLCTGVSGRSRSPLHWLLQAHLTAGRDDGQVIVHVVADEVTDALKAMIFCPHLVGQKRSVQEAVSAHVSPVTIPHGTGKAQTWGCSLKPVLHQALSIPKLSLELSPDEQCRTQMLWWFS